MSQPQKRCWCKVSSTTSSDTSPRLPKHVTCPNTCLEKKSLGLFQRMPGGYAPSDKDVSCDMHGTLRSPISGCHEARAGLINFGLNAGLQLRIQDKVA